MFEAHSSCCRCSCCCCRCCCCCCSQNTGFMVSILSVCWSSHDHHFTLFGYHYVLSVCFNASGRSAFFYRKVDMESLSFADTTVHAVNTKSRQAVTNLHICRLGRTSNIKTNKTTTTKTKKRKEREKKKTVCYPVLSGVAPSRLDLQSNARVKQPWKDSWQPVTGSTSTD